MITVKKWLEENPRVTMFGLVWAIIWRFWVAYMVVLLSMATLAIISSGLFS